MSKFRHFHLIQILTLFQEQGLPIDVFLKKYFLSHKAIGSHDRRSIAESVYKLTRWKSLFDFLYPEDSFLDRYSHLENFDPEMHLDRQDIPLPCRLSFPEAYFSYLAQEMGMVKAQDFCLASNTQAPTTIRANANKITRDLLFDKLKESHSVTSGQLSPYAIHFAKKTNFLALPEFKEGLFEVQDEASQLLAFQVAPQPGDHFLDFCAGSGGKTLAIAPSMQGKGQIYLHDIRTRALIEAKKRLKRAGVQNAQIADPTVFPLKTLLRKMDWVLVDAPCSGSGTLRRNPDMKWKFSLDELNHIVHLQREIFTKAFDFVKPGGRIVYATCSVLPIENEYQVHYFLEQFPLTLVSPPFSTFPVKGGMDGFYAAILQKC